MDDFKMRYAATLRLAVERVLAKRQLEYGAGLCYELFREGFGGSYEFMVNFAGIHAELGPHGEMTTLRVTVLLLLAELDDDSIMYFREAS